MIAWLKGVVVDIDGAEVVINSGDVGYRVLFGENLLYKTGAKPGKTIEVVIYTVVKEDSVTLFGFESFFSRKIFGLLLTVNGIGPKAAVNIVDQLGASEVVVAIAGNDHRPFLKVVGIGKKISQRIIIDLQNKIKSFVEETELLAGQSDLSPGIDAADKTRTVFRDAKSALLNLGFFEKQVDKVLKKYAKEENRLENLISKCLKDLNQ